MKATYLPKTVAGKLARLGEECAEVSMAVLKTLRVYEEEACPIEEALEGGNPELPPETRENNRDWILREIADLEHAIQAVKEAIE